MQLGDTLQHQFRRDLSFKISAMSCFFMSCSTSIFWYGNKNNIPSFDYSSLNDNQDRTRAEILSSLPIRKKGTGKKRAAQSEEDCLSASCFRWHSSAHQQIAWEENVIWYVLQGDVPCTNPIGNVQSFSTSLKKNEEISRLLSCITCIMWADGRRIRWIR